MHDERNVRTTLFASIGIAVAIIALLYRASLEPTLRLSKLEAVEYVFIFSATVGLINVINEFGDRLRLRDILQTRGLIVLFASALLFSVYKLGMYQIAGPEETYVINAAYHYLHGFKPITDYPSPMPPLFMAGIWTTVHMCSFRWSSLVLLNAVFAALTCLWLYSLFRVISLPRHWAFLITVIVELSTFFVEPFWWYNNTTSMSVILLLVSVAACLQKSHRSFSWISLSLALGMTLDSKPNVALMCFAPCVLLFTKRTPQFLKALASIVGAFVIAFMICRAAEIPIVGLFRSYVEVAKLRASPLLLIGLRQSRIPENMAQACIVLFVCLCFVDVSKKSVAEGRRRWPFLFACALSFLTCIEMICTNAELKSVDLIVLLVTLVLLLLPASESTISRAATRQTLITLLTLFGVWSGFFGASHIRVLKSCQDCFYEPLPTREIKEGFFTGLTASPRLLAVQQQVGDVLTRFPERKVFFGPRMEIEYAVFDEPLIPGLPVQWDAGTQYSQGREEEMSAVFKMQDPDLLIFMKHEYVRFGTVAAYIQHSPLYTVYDDYPDLTIYIRKGRAN